MTTEHDIARRDGQAHHYVWRRAIELAKQRAASSGDAAYWDREIEAFDRIFPVLVRQQPQAEAVLEMHDALCPALTGGDCTCTPPEDKAVPNDDARDAARYRRWRFYAWNKPSVAAKLLASAIDPDQIDAAVDAMPHHG